jgi:tRNA C32,U32 (ribose-2'-O)-methylase TrmJ
VAAVEVSLEAIRREPDPRRAVIAAYAAMERSLAHEGYPREESEAPLEYLRRVLAASTHAVDEVRTLTLLFQHAKFSDHAVDETMRSGAITALERIRTAASASA